MGGGDRRVKETQTLQSTVGMPQNQWEGCCGWGGKPVALSHCSRPALQDVSPEGPKDEEAQDAAPES